MKQQIMMNRTLKPIVRWNQLSIHRSVGHCRWLYSSTHQLSIYHDSWFIAYTGYYTPLPIKSPLKPLETQLKPHCSPWLINVLRRVTEPKELWGFIASALPRFDTGNLVVAFTTAAKVDEGGAMVGKWRYLKKWWLGRVTIYLSTYLYLSIYRSIYIYISMYLCIYISISIYIYIYIFIICTLYACMYIYIYTWMNHDLAVTSGEWWLGLWGIIPKWPYLRLVHYYDLSRYSVCIWGIYCCFCSPESLCISGSWYIPFFPICSDVWECFHGCLGNVGSFLLHKM